ncbi:MAG: glycosyltransferase [Elusimicrobia bacterium]|nr:glycosyltransferase [Elusimicrobiota bacterium]
MIGKTLIFIPTYNERENVQKLCAAILALPIEADILFLDDNSPDGTGAIIEVLRSSRKNIFAIHRAGKRGIGSAHYEGIRWAYERGYSALITMDADFTHSPEYIPEFIRRSRDCDVVVGSRYLQEKSLKEWNPWRKILTVVGHVLTKHLLKLDYDATGAYRLYRLDRVPREAFDLVCSRGYSFFFESLHILNLNRLRIREVPIHLPARTYGHSKMDPREAGHSLKFLIELSLTTLLQRERLEISGPSAGAAELHDPQDWDSYWKRKADASGIVYDAIAALYRKRVIRPALNHFIFRIFPAGSKVLHAGCGAGQNDADIRGHVAITALDISKAALASYGRLHQNRCQLAHGSIFSMPFADGAFDGIYNLGVMEHFTEEEIRRILTEFRRVLRPGGKAVLFWPPEFGLSVTALKMIHFVLNRILRRGVRLHPDEITRVKSRRHVEALCRKAGFELVEYYFGPRDLFTHSVVVLAKGSGPEAGLPQVETAALA